MCCNDKSNNNIANIFESIICLQQKNDSCEQDSSCTKPFLGPSLNLICLNTRPLNLYTCCNNELWTMPYTLNGVEGESSVFRVESLDNDCITCRVLAPNTDADPTFPYLATEDFFTIKLCCIGIIRCLGDTTVNGL